jgi:pseudaminic acid synthase
MTNFHFAGKTIDENSPCLIVAELSGNHLGKLENAEKLIKSAYEAGADAIKIQTLKPDEISMNVEGMTDENKKHFTVEIDHPDWKGLSYHKLYEIVQTKWEWHEKLKETAKKYGIPIFSTPFDISAVDFLEKLNFPGYKIASYEVVHLPLLKRVGQTKKSVIMSTGMATEEEIKLALKTLKENGSPEVALLHCLSSYPAPYDVLNLNKIKDMQKKFNCIVGFSDHSLTTDAAAMAVALGAKIVEKHLTLDRKLGGPDASFSIEPHEFRDMVGLIRDIENKRTTLDKLIQKNLELKSSFGSAKYGPINKFEEEGLMARPSMWAARDIEKGEMINEGYIKVCRPGKGLSPKYLTSVIGKTAKKNIGRGTPISMELFN